MTQSFYRPDTIDNLIGLNSIKKTLNYIIEGSKLLNEKLPSFCITGPSGTGKTTVASIISNSTKGKTLKLLGSDLKKDENIYSIVPSLSDGDVVYIEEAHTLSKNVQVVLLEWIENNKLLQMDNGGAEAPKVCFIFPTTNLGKISKPLRERCTILYTGYYSVPDLESILVNNAATYQIDLKSDPKALNLLAKSSRGTPRIAVMHRMNMLRKVMAVDQLPYNLETVAKMMSINGLNEWGLERNDLKYCSVLYDRMTSNHNRPVSKMIMQQTTGFDPDVIDNVVEPYLQQIGAIVVQSQGRIITDFGCQILDVDPISESKALPPLASSFNGNSSKVVDMDLLTLLVSDEATRKTGMKGISRALNLTYPYDNVLLKSHLEKIGYTVRRSAGIVPMEES